MQLFCKSQFPHKSVNSSSIITKIKNRFTDFGEDELFQNDLIDTFCETSTPLHAGIGLFARSSCCPWAPGTLRPPPNRQANQASEVANAAGLTHPPSKMSQIQDVACHVFRLEMAPARWNLPRLRRKSKLLNLGFGTLRRASQPTISLACGGSNPQGCNPCLRFFLPIDSSRLSSYTR